MEKPNYEKPELVWFLHRTLQFCSHIFLRGASKIKILLLEVTTKWCY